MNQTSPAWKKISDLLPTLISPEQFHFEALVDFCRTHQLLPSRLIDHSTEEIYNQLLCEQLFYKASLDYTPPTLSIPVHLLGAEYGKGPESFTKWEEVVAHGNLHTSILAGDHFSMLQPPHLEHLVQKLHTIMASTSSQEDIPELT
jgi:thioesterase domain-containing protein